MAKYRISSIFDAIVKTTKIIRKNQDSQMRSPCSYLGMHKSPKSNTGPRDLYLPYSRILCQIGSGRNTYGTPLKANPTLYHFFVGMGITPDLQMNFPSPIRLGIKQSYFRQRLNAHTHILKPSRRYKLLCTCFSTFPAQPRRHLATCLPWFPSPVRLLSVSLVPVLLICVSG